MPYIDQEARARLEKGGSPETPGELNYAITLLADAYLMRKGGIRYTHLNEVVGVLECAKLEIYRRLRPGNPAPYSRSARFSHLKRTALRTSRFRRKAFSPSWVKYRSINPSSNPRNDQRV